MQPHTEDPVFRFLSIFDSWLLFFWLLFNVRLALDPADAKFVRTSCHAPVNENPCSSAKLQNKILVQIEFFFVIDYVHLLLTKYCALGRIIGRF